MSTYVSLWDLKSNTYKRILNSSFITPKTEKQIKLSYLFVKFQQNVVQHILSRRGADIIPRVSVRRKKVEKVISEH